MADASNPVVELAKERSQGKKAHSFEVDGVCIRLVGVPSGTIQDAISRVKVPDVPTWYNPDKDRDEPNPNDPSYLKALEVHSQEQGRVATEAMIMFGCEIDQDTWPPQDSTWLRKLQLAARRGTLDLAWVDWEDEIDQQFLFLKYHAISNDRLIEIGQAAGLSQEARAQARASFQRPEAGDTD